MKRKIGWAVAACLLPAPVFALGLGKLVLESALNEPLEARIELLTPTREELDSLNIALADSVAFERAGVERQFALSGLKFELREAEEGPDHIRVYSRDAMREPFLNFLVEINWSKGRLVREYTVLLDPPLYDPGMRVPAPVTAVPKPATAATPSDATLDMEPGVSTDSPATSTMNYTGGDYGPVQEKETLWAIASQMRPNDSISVQQMMLALYRTNPEAFINNNINGLRRGQVLRMPPESELTALTREQAFAESQSQHAAWDPSQLAQAATPVPQAAPAVPQPPPAAAPAVSAAAPAPAKETNPELRLVAPDKAGTGAGQSAGDTKGAATGQNLDLANEQLSALTQENIDLKDRVVEAETIIEDLKRLIALKDDEIAALQNNLGASDTIAKPQEVTTTAEPEVVAPVPVTAATPEPVPEETSAALQEEDADAAPPQPVAPVPEPVQAVEPAPVPAEMKPAPAPAVQRKTSDTGIVGQVLTWLKSNMLILGAGLGAIILVIGGLVFVARRRHTMAVAAEDEVAAAVQFPDFAGSEDETILPGAGADADAANEERTQFAPPAAARKPDSRPAEVATAKTPAPAPAPAPEPQEDPLAELNVLLAYEDFAGAEKFVRDAIQREPDNLDFHSKLLEVFYASSDRRKYEQAAKVLYDKVGGSGPHWDMALVMWLEISPNRALFSEVPADEDQAAAPTGGVGMLDLTSKEKGADEGLDFDLGEMTADPSAQAATSAKGDDASDVLDVTASVGLGSDEELLSAAGGEDMLDLTGGQAGAEEIPDPAAAQTGEDLLDVTSHANLEDAGLDMDPLDVTVSAPSSLTDSADSEPVAEAGGSVDLDLSLDMASPSSDDNMLEFEPGLGEKADASAAGMDLDLSAGTGASPDSDAGLELDMGLGSDTPGDVDFGLDMNVGAGKDDDSGLSLDMPDAESAGEISLEMPDSDGGGLDFSFDSSDDTGADAAGDLGLSLDMDAKDDGADQTVVVPRTDGAQAQSAEDEVATKLDLAKAYVELGDKDSARGILDEIAAEGNEDQRRQAQELLQQVS